MRTAIIFDIDGTLIDSEKIDARFFVRAVRDILGNIDIEDDWSNYRSVTDIGIAREILERNGITPTKEIITAVRERFRSLLQAFFDRGESCRPVPGIGEFLRLLAASPDFTVGIATGGWGATALMKLASAGIDIAGIPISSSDDADDRAAIMLHCLAGMGGPFERIVYFGDGVWDRDACGKLGWSFVGIGGKLRGKCAVRFEDFRDARSIAAAISG